MPWLDTGFSKWLEHKINGTQQKLSLPTLEGYEVVKVSNIIRLEADGNYCRLILKDSSILMITDTLKAFENMLSHQYFYRVHQSHLINMNFIKKYLKRDGGHVLMENGDLIPVSRRKKEGFLEKLKQA